MEEGEQRRGGGGGTVCQTNKHKKSVSFRQLYCAQILKITKEQGREGELTLNELRVMDNEKNSVCLNLLGELQSIIVNGLTYSQDPVTTIIRYDGPVCMDNQTFSCVMLYTNGVSKAKFARLTWDGNHKIATLVHNRWDGCVFGYSGDSVHEDEIFQNAQYGIFTSCSCFGAFRSPKRRDCFSRWRM